MISVNELSYSFRGGPAILDKISFDIAEGHFLAVLGNNGAGKSTMLKCLNGIYPVPKETVYADGTDLHTMKRRQIARTMAYVEQSTEISRLTVYDVVLMGRHPYITAGPTEEDRRIVEDTMDQMGLRPLALRYVDELSGGELQKVIIARALAQQPKVLLLDEPTSSLDLYNQHEVMHIAMDQARKGVTVIVVIHDLNLALSHCDRFLFLKDGAVYDYGDSSVVTEQTIREIYGVPSSILEHDGQRIVVVGHRSHPTGAGQEE